MQKNPNLSRTVSRFAIAMVLGLSTVGLTQCRLMDDSVTGVDLADQSFHGRSTCIERCRDEFEEDMKKENARHERAMRACDNLKKPEDRRDCKKREKELHRDKKEDIKDQKRVCKSKCYNEGGGHGGR